jgi:hypothetical protein
MSMSIYESDHDSSDDEDRAKEIELLERDELNIRGGRSGGEESEIN